MFLTLFQNLPVHKPVIINLGEDSSDEEEEKKEQAPTGVQKLLGGLDSFLKEARRSTEVCYCPTI